MPARPNSKPSNGKKPIKAVVAVKPISEDKAIEPQALQPAPNQPTTRPERPTPASFLMVNCFLK